MSRPTRSTHDHSRRDGRDAPTRDSGFTLIELLVVVVILGILIGIAIPVYLNYRKSANDKAAHSDLRSAIGVLELCMSSDASYPASIAAGATAGTSGAACTGQTIAVSAGTTLAYFPISSSNLTGYIIGSTNVNGSGKLYCYNSTKGGSVTTTTTAVTAYRATC
jgi:type IV pilus assembly protein PilA